MKKLYGLIIFLGLCFLNPIFAADAPKDANLKTTLSLLNWMQINLKSEANFSVNDLEIFFAPSFIIDTNGKMVKATPATYQEYLYKFKANVTSVSYEIQSFINANSYVVAPFIINIAYKNPKNNQKLRVIAIFKFDDKGKITLWQEVFTKAS